MKKVGSYSLSRGFTIVELLIVIVIIGILASLVIVAYNGIQQRSSNTKTIAAVQAWAKIIKLYHSDKSAWPNYRSCLGDTDTYGNATTCWSNSANPAVPAFLADVRPYAGAGKFPEPDLTANAGSASVPLQGALYNSESGNTIARIYFILGGGSTDCPPITGMAIIKNATYASNVQCRGTLD